jgi:mannose-1-phosphate guanylyltransferase
MKALILVGGLGTRLRPLTINTPKAMMPVLNKPFMAHVVDHLMHHGVDEVIFTRGHLAGQMENYFRDNYNGCKMIYVDETRPLGTAGGIKNCERYLDDTFFALNGDVFSTIDLSAMLRLHVSKNAAATIALTPVENPSAFGLVETENDGKIRRFIEKPKPEEITTNLINAGCYVLEPEVLNLIQPDANVSIERETFQLLLKSHRPFYAFVDRHSYWIDMGNRDKYFQLNMDMLNGRCRFASIPSAGVQVGADTQIDAAAVITGNVFIGRNCRVGAGVSIKGPCVLGDDCVIKKCSTINNSIFWSGVNVGDDCAVADSIIAENCCIYTHNRLTASALADGVFTPPDMALDDCQIWPGTVLSN